NICAVVQPNIGLAGAGEGVDIAADMRLLVPLGDHHAPHLVAVFLQRLDGGGELGGVDHRAVLSVRPSFHSTVSSRSIGTFASVQALSRYRARASFSARHSATLAGLQNMPPSHSSIAIRQSSSSARA